MLLVYCCLTRISNAGLSTLLLLLVFAPQSLFSFEHNFTWQKKKEEARTDVFRVMSIDFLFIYIYINVVGLVARVVIVVLTFNW